LLVQKYPGRNGLQCTGPIIHVCAGGEKKDKRIQSINIVDEKKKKLFFLAVFNNDIMGGFGERMKYASVLKFD
jgi:hypothetical protein